MVIFCDEEYKYKIPYQVDITTPDNSFFSFGCDFVKETSKSIYAKSYLSNTIYRIEKSTHKVFCKGIELANNCDYTVLHYYTNEEV